MIERYLSRLGFQTSGNGASYKKRCIMMLACTFAYYGVSVWSVSDDGIAWFIVLFLNMLSFSKVILGNTISCSETSDRIAGSALGTADRPLIFHLAFCLVKSAFEIGIFTAFSIFFIWGIRIDWEQPKADPRISLIKVIALILYLLLLLEDTEDIVLVAYCSTDSAKKRREDRE